MEDVGHHRVRATRRSARCGPGSRRAGSCGWTTSGAARPGSNGRRRSAACCRRGVSDRRSAARAPALPLASSSSSEFPQIPSIQSWRGNRCRHLRARLRQRDAGAQGDPRPPWQRDGVHDAQHRHLGRLGARRRGSALLLPVLAQGLRRRHQRGDAAPATPNRAAARIGSTTAAFSVEVFDVANIVRSKPKKSSRPMSAETLAA